MSDWGEYLQKQQDEYNAKMARHRARFEQARIDRELNDPNRAPGDIPLTEMQKTSDNWFWVAVREANAHARWLATATPAERKRDLLKLGMGH